jgi:hypothetical protein
MAISFATYTLFHHEDAEQSVRNWKQDYFPFSLPSACFQSFAGQRLSRFPSPLLLQKRLRTPEVVLPAPAAFLEITGPITLFWLFLPYPV